MRANGGGLRKITYVDLPTHWTALLQALICSQRLLLPWLLLTLFSWIVVCISDTGWVTRSTPAEEYNNYKHDWSNLSEYSLHGHVLRILLESLNTDMVQNIEVKASICFPHISILWFLIRFNHVLYIHINVTNILMAWLLANVLCI